MCKLKQLILFVLLSYVNCSTIHPGQLKVEHLTVPLAVDSPNPRLSWVLQAVPNDDKTVPRNLFQTAYQIAVASKLELLRSSNPDLWDSNKVKSDSTINVRYQGKVLEPGQTVFWAVRVWDQNDNASQFSEVSLHVFILVKVPKWNS